MGQAIVAERVTLASLRTNLSEVINRTAFGGARVILTSHGKELAALLPLADAKLIQYLNNYMDLQRAKASIKDVNENELLLLREVLDESDGE